MSSAPTPAPTTDAGGSGTGGGATAGVVAAIVVLGVILIAVAAVCVHSILRKRENKRLRDVMVRHETQTQPMMMNPMHRPLDLTEPTSVESKWMAAEAEHATSADSFGRSVSLVDYPADNNQSLVDDDSKDSTITRKQTRRTRADVQPVQNDDMASSQDSRATPMSHKYVNVTTDAANGRVVVHEGNNADAESSDSNDDKATGRDYVNIPDAAPDGRVVLTQADSVGATLPEEDVGVDYVDMSGTGTNLPPETAQVDYVDMHGSGAKLPQEDAEIDYVDMSKGNVNLPSEEIGTAYVDMRPGDFLKPGAAIPPAMELPPEEIGTTYVDMQASGKIVPAATIPPDAALVPEVTSNAHVDSAQTRREKYKMSIANGNNSGAKTAAIRATGNLQAKRAAGKKDARVTARDSGSIPSTSLPSTAARARTPRHASATKSPVTASARHASATARQPSGAHGARHAAPGREVARGVTRQPRGPRGVAKQRAVSTSTPSAHPPRTTSGGARRTAASVSGDGGGAISGAHSQAHRRQRMEQASAVRQTGTPRASNVDPTVGARVHQTQMASKIDQKFTPASGRIVEGSSVVAKTHAPDWHASSKDRTPVALAPAQKIISEGTYEVPTD